MLIYEFIEIPNALANAHGTLRATYKVALSHILTGSHIQSLFSIAEGISTCCNFNVMAMVQSIVKPARCTTFGDLADVFVRAVHSILSDIMYSS